jgi:hypothetical protein
MSRIDPDRTPGAIAAGGMRELQRCLSGLWSDLRRGGRPDLARLERALEVAERSIEQLERAKGIEMVHRLAVRCAHCSENLESLMNGETGHDPRVVRAEMRGLLAEAQALAARLRAQSKAA